MPFEELKRSSIGLLKREKTCLRKIMKCRINWPLLTVFLYVALFILFPYSVNAEVKRVKFNSDGNYMVVEILDDDLLHVEYGRGNGPDITTPVETTEMVCKSNDNLPPFVCKSSFSGPKTFKNVSEGVMETKDIRLEIDRVLLLATVIDKTKNNLKLTTIRPFNLEKDFKGLIATRSDELDIYGLGQQFLKPGSSDFDWDGEVREGGEFGNVMEGFNGGANGNTQIPVIYAVNGATYENYALFLDNKYKQRWDFTSRSQWKVEMFGDQIRFYIMTGKDLPDLRKDYLELSGKPLVPPKKMFGLWVSEYGYDNWSEMEDKLKTLRNKNFPVDGFVLDLQWFGGIKACSDNTQMGSLNFDDTNFPDHTAKIKGLKERDGIGIMLIEEAYIGKALSEYTTLKNRGCLVTESPGSTKPAYITGNCWWGKGGMLDYTDDTCSAFWHKSKRKPLIESGVIGHWTDLGEPEMYSPSAGYSVGTHADAHNIFNFRWLRGIYKGYLSENKNLRPFMMSRSGTAGIQRFGAAMWSGDIGSRLKNLASHAANQMNMSFSGIDYYGADIGGFHRNLTGDLDEMYTQWFAYGMMFDIPGRPHVENLCNCKETAPDRIGALKANLENARLRYSLVPYLYSLAHLAYKNGDPLMPPPVYYYQTDTNLRGMGSEKMIGRDLLAAVVTRHGQGKRDVYLPSGTWVNYRSNKRVESVGQWITGVKVSGGNGLFRIPLYAREGAIIPIMHVDEMTLNVFGKRGDNTVHTELMAKVFSLEPGSQTDSSFTLFEDDGRTLGYTEGKVRTTLITQKRTASAITVTVSPSSGTYDGAINQRKNVIELLLDRRVQATGVTLNSKRLKERKARPEFNNSESGWISSGTNTVMAKSKSIPVANKKEFVFTLEKSACTSDFNSISVPGSGNGWNPGDQERSLSCINGTEWKGRVTMGCEKYKFTANGAWDVNWGVDGRQNGPDFPMIKGGIYDITFREEDPANPQLRLVTPISCPREALFSCDNGHTTFGTSVYVVGNIPELGDWNTEKAVKLNPDGPYPKWTGVIKNLPGNTSIEWKCIKRPESGGAVSSWEPGENNFFRTPSTGNAGIQTGSF